MKLAYIIPSYCRPEILLLLLDNIYHQTINTILDDISIIVSIDNIDPQKEQYISLINQYKTITEYQEELGFIKTNILINQTTGLVKAKNNAVRSTNAELIMMLDDDLYMEKQYIEKLYKDIIKSNNNGAISGYIVSTIPAISHTQPSIKVKTSPPSQMILQRLNLLKNNGKWMSLFGKKEQVMDWSMINKKIPHDRRYEMDYFVNSYMFTRKAYDAVGGYNEKLNSKTSAHEEVDFTFRIKQAGYKLLFNPFARMHHITVKQGGIYKGDTFDESKQILETEYQTSTQDFLKSIRKGLIHN